MKKLEMNQMEKLQGGGTQDWCDAIDGLGGIAYIDSLGDPMGGYIGNLYGSYCM